MEVTDRAYPVATTGAATTGRRPGPRASSEGIAVAGMRLTHEAVRAIQREASDKTRRGVQAMTEGDVHQALLFYTLALNTVQQLFNVVFGGGVFAESDDDTSLQHFQSAYKTSVATLQSDIVKLQGRVLELRTQWETIQDKAFGSAHAALQGEPVSGMRQAFCSPECQRIRASEVVFDPKRCGKGKANQGSWFDAIIGMEEEKRTLMEQFAEPLVYPSLYGRRSRAVLMHGPPGTGKTLLAQALPVEVAALTGRKVRFFSPAHSDLKGRYVGESEKNIRFLFKCAADAACETGDDALSIVFIDEIDTFMGNRAAENASTATISVVNALLQEMDGVSTRPNVIVIGATNTKPEHLDEAARRRFQTDVRMKMPNVAAIAEQLRYLYWRHIKGYDPAGASACRWNVKERSIQECIAADVAQCSQGATRKWKRAAASATATKKPWDNLSISPEYKAYVVMKDSEFDQVATKLHEKLKTNRATLKAAASSKWKQHQALMKKSGIVVADEEVHYTYEVTGATQSDITSAWNSLIVTAGVQAMQEPFEKTKGRYLSTKGRPPIQGERYKIGYETPAAIATQGGATIATAHSVKVTLSATKDQAIKPLEPLFYRMGDISAQSQNPLPAIYNTADEVFVNKDGDALIAYHVTYTESRGDQRSGAISVKDQIEVQHDLHSGNRSLKRLKEKSKVWDPEGDPERFTFEYLNKMELSVDTDRSHKDRLYVLLRQEQADKWKRFGNWMSAWTTDPTVEAIANAVGYAIKGAWAANGRALVHKAILDDIANRSYSAIDSTLADLLYNYASDGNDAFAKFELDPKPAAADDVVALPLPLPPGDLDKCATWTITPTAILAAFNMSSK